MKKKFLPGLFFLLACAPLSLLQAAFTPVIPGETEVGNVNSSVTHISSFELVAIPEKPRLEIKFKVNSAGHCPAEYWPTTLSMNGEKFAELDFRHYNLGVDKTEGFDIPRDLLKLGTNELKIVTGECNYGVDSMTMDSITLQ